MWLVPDIQEIGKGGGANMSGFKHKANLRMMAVNGERWKVMRVTDDQNLELSFWLLLWILTICHIENNEITEVDVWVNTKTTTGWCTFYVNVIIDRHELWNLEDMM
jgi:hypothetical protein